MTPITASPRGSSLRLEFAVDESRPGLAHAILDPSVKAGRRAAVDSSPASLDDVFSAYGYVIGKTWCGPIDAMPSIQRERGPAPKEGEPDTRFSGPRFELDFGDAVIADLHALGLDNVAIRAIGEHIQAKLMKIAGFGASEVDFS